MLRAKIIGLGSYVPERIVTNDELRFLDDQHVRQDAPRMETSDEWIRTRTGIEERRYVPNDGKWGASDVGLPAAKRALDDAGIEAKDVDCIIFATLSPDIHFPGSAVFLQTKLGIDGESGCACYDIRQQCSGFVYGMQMADAFIRTGLYKKVLLVGAEVHSHSLDFSTRGRDVTVLFGDGAGAVVIRAGGTDEPGSVTAHLLGSDGDLLDIMKTPAGGSRQRSAGVGTEVPNSYFTMSGRAVYKHAINRMTRASTAVMEQMGWGVDDVDWLVAHQANRRILTATADAIGIAPERAVINVDRVANTSAASIPLAFVDAMESGQFTPGDKVLLAAFGGGATWAAAALTWPELPQYPTNPLEKQC